MARIRTIKPEYWGDAKTAQVSRDARLLFIGLLNESDDEGRQLASPRRIAGIVFPHDEDITTADVTRWLDELERATFITRYGVDGVTYLLICGFTEHQKISHPTQSRLPSPAEATPETLPNISGDAPEVLGPDLGSGSRNMEVDLGIASAAEATERELVPVVELVPAKKPRARDELWEALLEACAVDSRTITASARGAYNRAAKDLRAVNATPDDVYQRAEMHRLKWPGTTCTPTSLARHWAELVPSLDALPMSETMRNLRQFDMLTGGGQ